MLQTVLPAVWRRRGGSDALFPTPGRMPLVVLAGLLAVSSTLDGAVRPTPLDHEMHTLDNGLRVILSEDHSTPIVHPQMVYHVGSKNERPGRTGFAHLFEHMMFKGLKNVLPDSHLTMIPRVGGEGNAYDHRGTTTFLQAVLRSGVEGETPAASRHPPPAAVHRRSPRDLPQSDNRPPPAVIVAHHITCDGHPEACPLHLATKVLSDGESPRNYRRLTSRSRVVP